MAINLRKQAGYCIISDPEARGGVEEQDSFTCGHCSTVVWCKPFQPGEAMGGRCTHCDKLICLRCVGKGCTPLEARLEQWERDQKRRMLNMSVPDLVIRKANER